MKPTILAFSVALLICFATTGEAKRLGGGSSSGSHTTPSKHSDNKADESPEINDKPKVNIRMPVSGSSGSSSGGATKAVGAAALGAAAGSAAANIISPEETKQLNEKKAFEEQLSIKLEEARKAREAADEALRKEQQARLDAIAATERAEQEKRAKQKAAHLAQIEKEKEIERQRQARERLCVIKPVMSDAEIAICKEVWR